MHALQQGRQAVRDELTHDERDVRPLHPRRGEDVPGDPVEVVGVDGDHLHHEVARPGQPAHLGHLGDRGEGRADLGEAPLVDLRVDERPQRVAQAGRVDAAFERPQDTALLEPREPGLHRVAGQAQPLGQRDRRRPWVFPQRLEQARVDLVDGFRHAADLSTRAQT
jgi:hypothetical protein